MKINNWYALQLLWLLCFFVHSGCAELNPSWRGFFIGTQVVTPYKSAPALDSASIYGTAIIGLGERNSLQLQVSEPVTAWDTPVLRVAVDRKIF